MNNIQKQPGNKNKRVRQNIMFAFIVKGGSVIVGVLTIPAYMRYFQNSYVLGVWYTLLSLLTWILSFDLGIGNGMRNHLAKAMVQADDNIIKRIISSSYVSISGITLIFCMIGLVLVELLDWNSVFKISQNMISANVLKTSVRIVLIGILSQFLLKLIASVLNAMERTALTSLLPLLSNIIVLAYVTMNQHLIESDKLISLSWVYTLAVNIPYLVATIIIFRGPFRDSSPRLSAFNLETAKNILSLGGRFFGIQIALMIISVTNEIFITRLYGSEFVVNYQVYNKIFYTIVTLFSLITNPLWSAITTANYERKYRWIWTSYRKIMFLAVLTTVAIVITGALFQFIVNLWLKENAILVDFHTTIAFTFYATVLTFCYAESTVANGISKLRTQLVCYSIAAALKLPLCLLALKLFGHWNTIVFINGLCLAPYIFIQHYVLKRKFRLYA